MSKKTKKVTLKELVADIKNVAKKLGVHPQELTRATYLGNTKVVKDWDLRKLATFASVIRSNFPITGKDLASITETKDLGSYIRKLETALGNKELTETHLKDSIERHMKTLKIKAPSNKRPKKSKKGVRSEVVVCLNDTHYGAIIDGEEIGNINNFNWKEACRRTALLAEQVADYKINKRDRVDKLHVVLNGDIIQGVIHGLKDRTQDLLAIQITGATHILIHFLQHVLQFYPKVEVHALNGNHDDALHRRDGGRILSHKYDSYSQPIFYALSAAFRDNKNISFNIPKTLYTSINLPGGRLLVTHGDTIFSKGIGSTGRNIQVKGMSDSVNRFNAGEVSKGNEPFKAVLLGHVHVHASFTTFDGIEVQIMPSLSGTDGFAHSLGINHNLCKQMIFESTKGHVIGDPRLVDLRNADDMEELDSIIPLYNRGLKWE